MAAVADVAAIGVFAALGRASHAELNGVTGIAETAWPFVAGWAAGAALTRFWRRPASLPTGVAVWVSAVVGGMALRVATGAGVQPSFVIVAASALAILLLGWRAVGALAIRRRRTASTGA